MHLAEVLNLIDASTSEYSDIGREIIGRCTALGLLNVSVALSCIHSSSEFLVYNEISSPSVIYDLDKYTQKQRDLFGATSVEIDLSKLDELGAIDPRVILFFLSDDKAVVEQTSIVIREFCFRSVQRHRAMTRRAFIEAKIGADDIGTFCFRLLHESLFPRGPVSAVSIFVLDKRNGELRLRGQFPRRVDGRHLSDITVSQDSNSWLVRAFKNGLIAEYDPIGHLRQGKTIEYKYDKLTSRLYVPIRLQFRARSEAQHRVKDRTIGVLRLSNCRDKRSNTLRPFHCFDAFSAEFMGESLHNIIGSYVDRDVEGFDRDLAFHGAMTPANGCIKNIRLAAQLLFTHDQIPFLDERASVIPPQFKIESSGSIDQSTLIRALENAYAFSIDIAAQIDRANLVDDTYLSTAYRVDKLFSEVIQKAINLAPYIEVSHSKTRRGHSSKIIINRIFDLPLPPPVVGQAGALTSVFHNLIENSIKYSLKDEPAQIYFSWKETGNSICVWVEDNGIGIPAEDAERIFTRGVRSDRAKKHSVRGGGLGLSYCSRVLRSFGGSIKATPLEKGLRIEVTLLKAKVL